MSIKPVIPRAGASRDIDEAVDYYSDTAGQRVALGFIHALENALRSIADRPAAGSPRYAHELNLAGLRSWSLKRYPYIVFYVEQDSHIDVWRVLHAKRDVPGRVRDDPSF